jgi:hypothetical protein
MREKIQITFFIILVFYIAILSTGSYVSVYSTYFAIPTLAILGLLVFGSFKSIHNTASIVFWISLVLTFVTIASVSYVGVYLIYIVVPFLLISGFLMMITKNKS